MSKKHMDLVFRVKKDFSTQTTEKKGFEKEVDAVNVNKRISMKLLHDNFKSFINFSAMGIVGITGVYQALKNALGEKSQTDTPVENNGIAEEQKKVEEELNTFSSELEEGLTNDDFQSDVEKSMQSTVEEADNFVTSYTGNMQSVLDDTNETISGYVEDLNNSKTTENMTVNIDDKSTDFANKTNALAATDLSVISTKYVDSASNAMVIVSNKLDEVLIPKYHSYSEIMSSVIVSLNKIFNISHR
jgi:hypothetical protein